MKNHLVECEGPYLTLAEAQYCVSGASRFLPENMPISHCKLVHIKPADFLCICLHPIFTIFSFLGVLRHIHTQTLILNLFVCHILSNDADLFHSVLLSY